SLIHSPAVIYEFHTPFRGQMEKEISKLSLDKIHSFAVPSKNSVRILSEILPSDRITDIEHRPNLVDVDYLKVKPEDVTYDLKGRTPVLWIGRFDNQKNVNDFLRTLALLPQDYHGVAVVSLNDDGNIFADFMGDVYAYRVQDRISVLLNLSKRQMR